MKQILTYEQFNLNESEKIQAPLIKRGDKTTVKFLSFKGQPEYEVTSESDLFSNENESTFSFLHGGDMMSIAKWDGSKWISN